MQYVFSMTSRMVTIAASCAVLLCLLLFLLGVEIGTRMSRTSESSANATHVTPPSVAALDPAQPAATAVQPVPDSGDMAAPPAPASSTL
jgi:hypothetical protein